MLPLGKQEVGGDDFNGFIAVNAFIKLLDRNLPPSPKPAIVEMDERGRCTWRTAGWEGSKGPDWALTGDVVLFGGAGLDLVDSSGATHGGLGMTYVTGAYQIDLTDQFRTPLAPRPQQLQRLAVAKGTAKHFVAAFGFIPVDAVRMFADPSPFRRVSLSTCQQFWAENVSKSAPRPMKALTSNR